MASEPRGRGRVQAVDRRRSDHPGAPTNAGVTTSPKSVTGAGVVDSDRQEPADLPGIPVEDDDPVAGGPPGHLQRPRPFDRLALQGRLARAFDQHLDRPADEGPIVLAG